VEGPHFGAPGHCGDWCPIPLVVWALEPYNLGGFSTDGTVAYIGGVTRRNWSRKHIQPVGLALLFFSFAAQFVGVFLPVRVG
jgi:hypothetical protein